MIFCGLVGATMAGVFIDYTKLFKDVAILSLCFAILSLIWFSEVCVRCVCVCVEMMLYVCRYSLYMISHFLSERLYVCLDSLLCLLFLPAWNWGWRLHIPLPRRPAQDYSGV